MFKIFMFLSIFVLNIFAQTINFKEEKYLNALQTSVYKIGKIDFKKDSIEVSYKQSSSIFTFFDDYLVVDDGKTQSRFAYEDKIEFMLFYKLIEFLYLGKEGDIDEYFVLKNEQNRVVLSPKEYLANAIDKIIYKKNGSKLEFLEIHFLNGDIIKIAQT